MSCNRVNTTFLMRDVRDFFELYFGPFGLGPSRGDDLVLFSW